MPNNKANPINITTLITSLSRGSSLAAAFGLSVVIQTILAKLLCGLEYFWLLQLFLQVRKRFIHNQFWLVRKTIRIVWHGESGTFWEMVYTQCYKHTLILIWSYSDLADFCENLSIYAMYDSQTCVGMLNFWNITVRYLIYGITGKIVHSCMSLQVGNGLVSFLQCLCITCWRMLVEYQYWNGCSSDSYMSANTFSARAYTPNVINDVTKKSISWRAWRRRVDMIRAL